MLVGCSEIGISVIVKHVPHNGISGSFVHQIYILLYQKRHPLHTKLFSSSNQPIQALFAAVINAVASFFFKFNSLCTHMLCQFCKLIFTQCCLQRDKNIEWLKFLEAKFTSPHLSMLFSKILLFKILLTPIQL